jgi:hypothetical protein
MGDKTTTWECYTAGASRHSGDGRYEGHDGSEQ